MCVWCGGGGGGGGGGGDLFLFVVFLFCFVVVVVLLADVMMHSTIFFINGHMCIYSYMAPDIW